MTNGFNSNSFQNVLITWLKKQDPSSNVSIQRTTLGWIKVKVISEVFAGKNSTEREAIVDEQLNNIGLNLGSFPISSYDLLTHNEVEKSFATQLTLPLWSEILMSEDGEFDRPNEEDIPKKPSIITFYSFKGGVGRTTSLGVVAGILASRNRRVVMLDFDLESPGLSVLLRSDSENSNATTLGLVDYLYQRMLTPDQNIPKIDDCVKRVELNKRGDLFLVGAGEYNEDYIHRLADLDIKRFYKISENPLKKLLDDISDLLTPDVILIDARPGFSEVGAIALLDLADTAVICFSPTDQSFEGLRWIVKAARIQQKHVGKPDLRFLLTPMPPLSSDLVQKSISRVESWIEDHWGVSEGTTVTELYNRIDYNPRISILPSLVNGVSSDILNAYLPLADAIDASLPDIEAPTINQATSKKGRNVLQELTFSAATAQELNIAEIPSVFQRTEDFPKFLTNSTWLTRGAKGTGKTLLFRLFIENSMGARELSRDYVDLANTIFVAGHGQPGLDSLILLASDFSSYEHQAGDEKWQELWLNYALLRLVSSHPELRQITSLDAELVEMASTKDVSHSRLVNWLVQRAGDPKSGPKAADEFTAIDRYLQLYSKRVWIFYDELDSGFSSESKRRQQALEALLSWWLESGSRAKNITPKVLLREDIWTQLNFTNKGHYAGRSLELRWDEADLWRLVLRQALISSLTLRDSLEDSLGVTKERLDAIEINQLRQSLYPLWGVRMGRTKKAYTYNWIRTRIADGKNNCFPRSLILLLQEAVAEENNFSEMYINDVIIRPKALIEAFPRVSKQRVEEVRNEYPELERYLNLLQRERSPIDTNRLEEIWKLSDGELAERIQSMVDAGILVERSRPKDPPPRVYAVAELYLYGLDMIRRGQR